MILNVAQMLVAKESLIAVADLDMPFKTACRLIRLTDQLSPEFATIDKIQVKLFEKYGRRQGAEVRVLGEKLAEFEAERQPWLAEEINVTVEPVPMMAFSSIPNIKPKILAGLRPFVSGWEEYSTKLDVKE